MPERAPTVLVVEDEAIVAQDLREILADLGYGTTAIAASAEEVLASVGERCPDLVLMDIRIRGKRDGIETAALLRERVDVPVIYLTAHADDATLRRARETELYGYLLKPVQPAALRSALEIALHKHQVERRRRERARWEAPALHALADAVITVDTAGTITFMNEAAERLTGVSRAEAVGRPAHEIVQLRADRGTAPLPLEHVLSHHEAARVDAVTLARDAHAARVVSDSASPIVDGERMVGAVMVLRDITTAQQQQRQLELADRLASLATMAGGVAHEINTPLAVVLANAAYLAGELRAPAAQPLTDLGLADAAVELEAAALRIAKIVADLRAFARPTLSPAGQADVATAVHRALRVTIGELQGRARVLTELAACPRVAFDEAQLGQVLTNLLTNAAQAIAPGAPDRHAVTVRARVEAAAEGPPQVLVEIRDTGAGIPPEIQRRVFEPFFTTRDVGAGSGLGLAICHGIVSSAGGRIELDSALGVGTTVRMYLPVARPPDAGAAHGAARRGRLLVIDDEPLMLRAMHRMLRDHDVVCVDTAVEALAMLASGDSFDVILSDLMMPGMTGMALYEQLLAVAPDAARRVVFVTGGAVDPRVAEFLETVPNTWLEKPVRPDELRALVQARLAAQPAP